MEHGLRKLRKEQFYVMVKGGVIMEGNAELYYAIVNVIDWFTKDKKRMEDPHGFEFDRVIKTLETLGELGRIYPDEVADANDCGEKCETWNAVIYAFEKLWENGERE